MTYSLAGYYIDWNKFQFDETTPAGQLGVFNGSDARSIGVELEANGRITEQLHFNLGYSYTDAEVTEDFVIQDLEAFGGVFTNTIEDSIAAYDGDNLPNVPKHSFSGGLDFEQPLMNNWFLNWHVDTSFRSKSQSTFNRMFCTAETTLNRIHFLSGMRQSPWMPTNGVRASTVGIFSAKKVLPAAHQQDFPATGAPMST